MTHRTILASCTLLIGIAGLTFWLSGGYVVAEKAAVLLMLPVSCIWLLATLVLILAMLRKSRALIWSAVGLWVVTYAVTSPLLATALMRSLEAPYLAIKPLDAAPFDSIILLGGGTNVGGNGTSQLTSAGDRLVLAARMYKQGLTQRIICAGERITAIDHSGLDPAESARQILQGLGVPGNAIEKVGGINTSMEMNNIAGLLQPRERTGLVTSAWHLPRAIRLAQSRGLELEPLPADFSTPFVPNATILSLIPDADAARDITLAVREYLAMLLGR